MRDPFDLVDDLEQSDEKERLDTELGAVVHSARPIASAHVESHAFFEPGMRGPETELR